MKHLKIAILQTNIIWENKKENILRLKESTALLRGKEIDVLFLPEMCFTGFSMNIEKTQDRENETLTMVRGLAEQEGIAIGFGWVKANMGKGENHYTVVGKDGEILSDYIKLHPFSFAHENQYFYAGNALSFYELNGICLSDFICYDLRFPEIFQIASQKAHIIVIAANWPAKRALHWNVLLRARAIENQAYIVAINCEGKIGGLEYEGGSCVISPNGEVLARPDERGLLICDIHDDTETYRHQFPVKNDRRDELYKTLKI